MRLLLIILSIIIVLYAPGCQTAQKQPVKAAPAINIPDWIRSEPKIEGMICAIGSSGPTYYKDDAKEYAAENARKELAKTLQIKIDSFLIDYSNEKGTTIDEATVAQITSTATSAVVENSKVIDYWYDEEGIAVKGKKFSFALCCMPRKINSSKVTGGTTTIERKINQNEIDHIMNRIFNTLDKER